MARSGPARGISAIRKALAEYVAMKPTIQLTTRRIVQVEDTALLVAVWRFHGTTSDGGNVSTSGTTRKGQQMLKVLRGQMKRAGRIRAEELSGDGTVGLARRHMG